MRAQNGWRLRRRSWRKAGLLPGGLPQRSGPIRVRGGNEEDHGGFEGYGPAEIASAKILAGLMVAAPISGGNWRGGAIYRCSGEANGESAMTLHRFKNFEVLAPEGDEQFIKEGLPHQGPGRKRDRLRQEGKRDDAGAAGLGAPPCGSWNRPAQELRLLLKDSSRPLPRVVKKMERRKNL
jgi:hypothetical protein